MADDKALDMVLDSVKVLRDEVSAYRTETRDDLQALKIEVLLNRSVKTDVEKLEVKVEKMDTEMRDLDKKLARWGGGIAVLVAVVGVAVKLL